MAKKKKSKYYYFKQKKKAQKKKKQNPKKSASKKTKKKKLLLQKKKKFTLSKLTQPRWKNGKPNAARYPAAANGFDYQQQCHQKWRGHFSYKTPNQKPYGWVVSPPVAKQKKWNTVYMRNRFPKYTGFNEKDWWSAHFKQYTLNPTDY